MDGFLIKELADMIKRLSGEGKTVVMISHEIPLVFKTVDEAIILNQGRKFLKGSGTRWPAEMIFLKISISSCRRWYSFPRNWGWMKSAIM